MGSSLIIKTPEGIAFSFTLAGPVTRMYAWLVDFCVVMLLLMAFGTMVKFAGFVSTDFAAAFSLIAYFVVSIGYGVVAEWYWRGQTLGKKFMHLRVVDESGMRLEFNQVLIRNLLRFIDNLPFFYLVGGMACLVSRRAQRLGDFAANTIVVHNAKIGEPDLDQLALGKFNSLRQYPHLAARLRQRVSPAEARIAFQAVVRRGQFDPAARIELFADLATYFKSLAAFPHEATESLVDEQYVRNVVDLLFSSEKRV